jgi:hypothetical protein
MNGDHLPGIQFHQPQAEGYAYAQIEKLLKHQHFEENQRINSPPTCIAFALLRITFFEQWAK